MGQGCVNRRTFVGALTMALSAGSVASQAQAAESCTAMTTDAQKAVTPAQAIERLKAGNARFVAGTPVNCDLMAMVKATAGAQAPFAAVVGCIDSRVPPELVFDQKIGDIFAARVAGNFVNTDIIGSVEFATKVAGAKAIVVLGHSSCGAVKGAIDEVKMGNLTAVLANIEPAVKATPLTGQKSSKNDAFVEAVADTNAKLTVQTLLARSAVIKELVDSGALAVVAAKHNVATGQVTFFA
ncbi:MAG: carbonic anhydrase family protein [Rhodospirillaceae bacterium]|nr:carbonic anhydrase family protein [Rhodospirillaceae bacterium]